MDTEPCDQTHENQLRVRHSSFSALDAVWVTWTGPWKRLETRLDCLTQASVPHALHTLPPLEKIEVRSAHLLAHTHHPWLLHSWSDRWLASEEC